MEPVVAYLFIKSWIPCLEANIPSFSIVGAFLKTFMVEEHWPVFSGKMFLVILAVVRG